jgi:hypothetical protein
MPSDVLQSDVPSLKRIDEAALSLSMRIVCRPLASVNNTTCGFHHVLLLVNGPGLFASKLR